MFAGEGNSDSVNGKVGKRALRILAHLAIRSTDWYR